jgi:hypothetical protein
LYNSYIIKEKILERKELRELARKIAKAEEKKDYQLIEKLSEGLSIEDMMRLDNYIQKIIS